MDQSQMRKTNTVEGWMKELQIKCEPDNRILGDATKYSKIDFFKRLTLVPVFHVYRASVDHCTCAYAQHYRGKSKIGSTYEEKYIKGYKVALLERRRH